MSGRAYGHADLLLAANARLVILLRGVGTDGVARFAFLSVRGDKIPRLREAMNRAEFNPADYGDILLEGPGEPTDAEYARMAEEYGFNREAMIDIPPASDG